MRNIFRGTRWKTGLALLSALALCAAASAVAPPAEEEPGWLPRVEGLTLESSEWGDAGTYAPYSAAGMTSAAEVEALLADGSAALSDTAPFSAPASEAASASSTEAASAPVSEEEAAMAFDPEHPDGPADGGTGEGYGGAAGPGAAENAPSNPPENPPSNPSAETPYNPPADTVPPPDAPAGDSGASGADGGTAPPQTLPEVEALLSGPEEDGTPTLAGPDDGGVREAEEPTDRDVRDAEKREQLIDQVTAEPVRLDSLAFADVESMARSGNLTVLGLEETIGALDSLDYDKLLDTLRDSLNALSSSQDMMQSQLSALNQMNAADRVAGIAAMSSINSLRSSYNSLYQQFEAIYKGDLQRDNRDTARQLRNTIDQIVMGAETLYISLCALEIQQGALDRQLAAMDRTVEEMELRHELGQISDLQLGEVQVGRAALASGRETLGMNVRTLKMQLENMLGAVPAGTLALGSLPSVTQAQLDAMDVEADLAAARERSYELYAAARTLEDQQETYQDAARSARYNERSAAYQQALHTWNANQSAYNAAVRSYELRFRTLCEQVRDYYQVWNAARTALAQQNRSWQAAQLRYQQGNISRNALLSAEDDLRTAMEKVESSANDLFSAYNNYCWAVQHGILN